jgi:predicted ATPase/DNA-binding SARP family transcriptional activator
MARLTISVMGELLVLIDGVPVSTFESDKVRALLIYLAVEAGRAHRRETLIGLLWPDCSKQVARHNLSQALFNLRLALGDHTAKPSFLLISRDAIQFNQESDYSLDVQQFNDYFMLGEENLSQESVDSTTLLAQLEVLVNLYRGEFLQQFFLADSVKFEEWILGQREILHQRLMNSLTTLVDQYEQQADYVTARRFALRQLELDPWREEAHCQIMRLLALEGQRSAALAQYESCRKVLMEELGVEPSSQTRELYEQIRLDSLTYKSEQSTQPSSTPLHNLPVSITPFIGREQELADLTRLITGPEYRCITLTGPGGIGKTRLAMEAAEQHSSVFFHGSAFIPLTSVGTLDAVIPAIANGIGYTFYGPTDPKIQLYKYLREKQLLLIIDNVEHLLVADPQQETIANLLVEILQAASEVKLLVTSREVLNLQGEWSFEVQGLAFPGVGQMNGFDEYSAVTLFVQRARRARPGFEMNDEDKPGVLRLCRLVEGMPLALELAAAWVRILSPEEITNEIETSLNFLNAQVRDLPERHRSMRAVFDHSWHMLTEEEQQVLRRMSVFRGSFTREAAEAIAGSGLALLSALVTKSFLRRTSEGRYTLHELIRQYISDHLAGVPEEEEEARDQHSAYYTDYIARLEGILKGAGQLQALAAMDADLDNIRVGWRWAVRQGQTVAVRESIRALWYYYDVRGWFQEGESTFGWTADQLEGSTNAPGKSEPIVDLLSAYARALQGWFYMRRGKLDQSQALLQSTLASLRVFGPSKELADALYYLGAVTWMTGDFQRGREYFLEELEVAEQAGNQWDIGLATGNLGLLAQTVGDYEEAEERWQTALAINRWLGDQRMVSAALHFYGILKRNLGAHLEAQTYFRESLELSRATGERWIYGMALGQLGEITHALGNDAEAVHLLNESVTLLRELGEHWSTLHALIGLGAATLSIGDYVASRDAYDEALHMSWEKQALPEVLEVMTGMAKWSTLQGAPEQALVNAIFVLNHQSATEQTKEVARQLRVELESLLTNKQIHAAQGQAESITFEKIVDQALTETKLTGR